MEHCKNDYSGTVECTCSDGWGWELMDDKKCNWRESLYVDYYPEFWYLFFSDFSANNSDISDNTDISDITANIFDKFH